MAAEEAPSTTAQVEVVTPPTPKGRDARRRILEAGEQLFGEHGYAGTRLADIADLAGLSSAAFYRYFKDRHELLLVLLRDMLDEAFAFSRARWDNQHPSESVQVTTERYFEFYDKNQALMGVIVEMAQTDDEVKSLWRQSRSDFYLRIGHALSRGVESGSIRSDIDVALAAELLGSMTEFYAFQRYALGDGALKTVSARVAATTLAEIWSHGVSLK